MKTIVITKNYYKVLEIIEFNSDKYKSEFKIVPMIYSNKFRIFYLKMFSLKKEIKFDTSKYIEITYHKAKMGLNTKIQLKIIDKNNNNIVEYIPLPLERLIDPNVNTEIPIPLLMIIVPDNVLKEPYVHKNKYVKFEMGNNNIFEIFMTKKDFISSNLFDKY